VIFYEQLSIKTRFFEIIRRGVNALPSNNSDKEIDYFKDPANPIFVVVGTGGRGLATLKGELPYVAYSYNKEYGFLNLDVNKEALTAKFYSNGAKNQIKDQFIILK
jgi:hypothetical protein